MFTRCNGGKIGVIVCGKSYVYVYIYVTRHTGGVRVPTCAPAYPRTSGHMIARVSRGMHDALTPTHHASVPRKDLVLLGTLSKQLG